MHAIVAITTFMKIFGGPLYVGAALCAIVHASDKVKEVVPIAYLLESVRPHIHDARVVSAACRLLFHYMISSPIPTRVQYVAETVNEFVKHHPDHRDVGYYASYIVVKICSLEDVDVKRLHGESGLYDLMTRTIEIATNCVSGDLVVCGLSWQQFILTQIYPSLRIRS